MFVFLLALLSLFGLLAWIFFGFVIYKFGLTFQQARCEKYQRRKEVGRKCACGRVNTLSLFDYKQAIAARRQEVAEARRRLPELEREAGLKPNMGEAKQR